MKKTRNVKEKEKIWFNPPYSKSIKTNRGKTFLQHYQSTFLRTIKSIKSLIRALQKLATVVSVISVQFYPPIINISWTQNKHLLFATAETKIIVHLMVNVSHPTKYTMQTANFIMVHQKQLLKNATAIMLLTLNM